MKAWAEITKVLAASPDVADRKLSKSIVDFVMQSEVVQTVQGVSAAQRQTGRPGMTCRPKALRLHSILSL